LGLKNDDCLRECLQCREACDGIAATTFSRTNRRERKMVENTNSEGFIRPRRSALYMPGANEKALLKGKELPADVLIMDLEDGVAPEAKKEARERIVSLLEEGGYGNRELCVRVNGYGSEWHDEDVIAISSSKADAIVLPKVDEPDAVIRTAALMDKSHAPIEMGIWCMLETAKGILNANAIASAHSRLSALTLGGADLTKDLRARHTRDRLPLVTAIQTCILAARANGLSVLDSPFFDLSDEEGFLFSCRQGRDFGFDGKTLIHPKTLAGANEIFGPSLEELEWARRITDAHELALKDGKGVTLVDGKLVEGLHVVEAQRLVQLAASIRKLAGN
jgi:citrate lyase subunit beta/citryl-CoA lyase